MTFDVLSHVYLRAEYGWQNWHEAFSLCRRCHRTTTFVIALSVEGRDHFRTVSDELQIDHGKIVSYKGALNNVFKVEGYVSQKDRVKFSPPEYVPDPISAVFHEGAACYSIGCNNAAGTMFRLCLDLATRPLLPSDDSDIERKPNARQRRDLGLRLPWLFEAKLLPEALADLATCIREDGNDGAHSGTLGQKDVEDILDFTRVLLERMFTEPKKLEIARARRDARREQK